MRFQIPGSLFLRRLWLAFAASLVAVSCSQQPTFEGARLSIEPESADFGEIQANDPVAFHNASLTLTNLGKERLEIQDIEIPEGFSYRLTPSKSIRQGGKASLKITIDRRKFSGRVSETAYVLSNDSAQPRIPISLQAEIVGDSDAPLPVKNIGPDISFDHKAFNFGTLGRYQTAEHAFNFKNLGDKPLKIQYIETKCLCVTARATKAEIAPGDSATIIAKIEPFKYPGVEVVKTLNIVTNDPDEPNVPLTVVAAIVDMARIEPKAIHLPNVQAGQPASAEAKLIQEGASDLIIRKIETSSPRITVASSPLTGEQKGYLLTITVAPDMPEGKFDELVTVFTNYTNYTDKPQARGPGREMYRNYRRLQLPVRGTVKGLISVTPRTINFGSAAPGESLRRKLVLSSDTTSFEITSLSIAAPDFSAAWAPIEPENKYEITVEFHPGGPERQVEDKLVITTTSAELVVPVFAFVKSGS